MTTTFYGPISWGSFFWSKSFEACWQFLHLPRWWTGQIDLVSLWQHFYDPYLDDYPSLPLPLSLVAPPMLISGLWFRRTILNNPSPTVHCTSHNSQILIVALAQFSNIFKKPKAKSLFDALAIIGEPISEKIWVNTSFVALVQNLRWWLPPSSYNLNYHVLSTARSSHKLRSLDQVHILYSPVVCTISTFGISDLTVSVLCSSWARTQQLPLSRTQQLSWTRSQ